MLIAAILLAFYLAWNLGANDVANSMGTSVGSKALTLRQAIAVAAILEFAGAVLFGQDVANTLATKIANPALFAQAPQVLLTGMVAVLLASGVWLNIATAFGLPVSSSHAVVGAIAGVAAVAISPQAIDWHSIQLISLTWILTPALSGAIAALCYSVLKHWILDHTNPIAQLREWIPWLSATLVAAFGILVLPTLVEVALVETQFIPSLAFSSRSIVLAIGAIASFSLTFYSWHYLESPHPPTPSLPHPPSPEPLLARFQVISACCVAFAHGSNDVGNAIAPLAVIVYIQHTGSVPATDFQAPLWVLVLGGVGIVAGLAVWGKKVIATIGEGIIPLQPSGGFCAELATAVTILLASKIGLPVSTSHALVGGVVGVGLVQNLRSIRFSTLKPIGLAWIVTIPVAAGLGAGSFILERWIAHLG